MTDLDAKTATEQAAERHATHDGPVRMVHPETGRIVDVPRPRVAERLAAFYTPYAYARLARALRLMIGAGGVRFVLDSSLGLSMHVRTGGHHTFDVWHPRHNPLSVRDEWVIVHRRPNGSDEQVHVPIPASPAALVGEIARLLLDDGR